MVFATLRMFDACSRHFFPLPQAVTCSMLDQSAVFFRDLFTLWSSRIGMWMPAFSCHRPQWPPRGDGADIANHKIACAFGIE